MKQERMQMFSNVPIRKLVLKMSLPAIMIMSIIGLYSFSDAILAINFAPDSIQPAIESMGVPAAEVQKCSIGAIRQIMAYSQPVFNLLLAITLMLTVGVSTRVSINLGRGDKERAINTIKTGMFFGMFLMFLTIPLFIFTAKTWVGFQLNDTTNNMQFSQMIIDKTFTYIWILSIANPIYFFCNLVSSLFRVEGRMREAGISMLIPVMLNLFMDWLFMGPCKMGVEGAALATALADVFTLIIILYFLHKTKTNTIITFKNMFGKFNWTSIIGIILVGISPFFRNFAQSINGSFQQHEIQAVNQVIYPHDDQMMRYIITSVFPIFGLFFPMLFGFVQGASPIAGFNYGAGNIKRVKSTIKWASLYSLIFALIIYGLSAGALTYPLLSILGVHDQTTYAKSRIVIAILMLGAPLFVPAISGIILFSSTDRIMFSFMSSIARGFVIFFPVLFLFKYLAISNPHSEYIFWWTFPAISLLTGFAVTIMGAITWRRLGEKHTTLDERIIAINKKISKK